MTYKYHLIAAALCAAVMPEFAAISVSTAAAQSVSVGGPTRPQPAIESMPAPSPRAMRIPVPNAVQRPSRSPGLIVLPPRHLPNPAPAPPGDVGRPTPDAFSQGGGEPLVPKYVAARAAQKVVSGKLLDVRLSKRGTPVYLVKLRDEAQIRVVVVDARTGQVLGY